MARGDFGFDMYAATASFADSDGFIGIQVDVEGGQPSGGTAPAGGSHEYEMISPGGLYHRPLDPTLGPNGAIDSTKAAMVMVHREGGHCVASCLTDPRVIPLLPQIEPGGTLVHGDNGSFFRIVGSGANVGRCSIFTTDDGTPNGNSVFNLTWPTGFLRGAPWGTEGFDASGWHLATKAGPSLDLGGMSGTGVPPGFGGYAILSADSIKMDGKTVQLGPKGAYLPIVLSTPMEAQLTALVAAQTTIIASITALVANIVAVLADGTTLGILPGTPLFLALTQLTGVNASSVLPLLITSGTTGGTVTAAVASHLICSTSTVAT